MEVGFFAEVPYGVGFPDGGEVSSLRFVMEAGFPDGGGVSSLRFVMGAGCLAEVHHGGGVSRWRRGFLAEVRPISCQTS